MGTALYKYRSTAPNTYYHIYNRGNQRRDIFLDEADYRFYLDRLTHGAFRYHFSILSYCLMPNHIHLIVLQNDQFTPASFISSLHTSYSMMFNKKYDHVGHLFQDRYKVKIITNDEYMKALVAYIHLNPVKAEMCVYPKEYRWSSYREYANLTHVNICDQKLVAGYGFSGQGFVEYINLAGRIDPSDAFDTEDSPLQAHRGLSSKKGL